MRISSLMIYEQIKKGLQGSLEELSRRNEELASGKRLLKPSDDVTGSSRAIDYRVNISSLEQYIRNSTTGDIQFQFTDSILGSVSDALVELKKLTSFGINPSDPQARQFYAQRSAMLRDYLLQLSNTRLSQRYIFSGFMTSQESFVYNPATFRYEYQGDLGEINIPLSNNFNVPVNIPGSKVFSTTLRGAKPSQLSDGAVVNYSESLDPLSGVNTITIEIGAQGDPEYDTFTVTNIMDMANFLSYAWRYQHIDGSSISETKAMHRIEALSSLIDDASTQILEKQSEMATRQVFLNQETERIKNLLNNLKNNLSKTEDADLTEVAVEIKKAETGLEALRIAAAKILAGSLLDFLK
ncbi:MAG: flagellar hook-associated protein FlgL [Thermodesulfovibrionales bacterium]